MKIKISELYKLITEFYGNNIPDDALTFQNEPLANVVKKKGNTLKIKLSNDVTLLPSEEHPFVINGKEVMAKNIYIGQELHNGIYPVEIEKFEADADLYDVTIGNESNIYELGGVLHHNTSNTKIRNILRNILNGSLGNSAIPKGVYIIMSSNVDDSGVSDIPLNQDFHMIKQDKPEAEDFMSFMYSKYVQPETQVQLDPATGEPIAGIEPVQDAVDSDRPDTGPVMQPEVFNAFYEEIKNANMSVQDDNVDVRTSPRRLEQIMIYINACVPVSSIEEIEKIKGFIKVNLMNYETLEISSEITKYDTILKKIIEQTSPEFASEYDKIQPIDSSSWKNSLQQQLEVKEKIGEERSYIPILSGAPGIGKTSQCAAVAKDLGKGYIHIDVSSINAEDAVGIPIPETDANGKITTKFSEPNLYRVIMNKYDEIIELYKKPGRKYNIILLFDELNRTTVPVFNALRAVLLTKSFGPSYKLPADIMMVGAINPSDAGAITLTGHMKDVVDIIPSTANYTETMDYIKSIKELDSIEEELGFDVTESLVGIVDSLVNTFKSEFNTAGDPLERSQRPFFWTTGADVFYISPREMTEMIKLAAISIKKELFKNLKYSKDLTYTEEQYSEIQKACVNVTAGSFELTFNNILTKQKLDADIAKMISAKIVSSDVILAAFNTIAMKKSVHEASLDSIFVQYKNDVNALDSGVIGQYLTYGTVTSFGQDIQEILYLINKAQSNMDLVKSVVQLDKVLLKSLERVQANFSFAEVVKTQTRGFIKGFLTNYKASSTLEYFDFLNSPELNSMLQEMQARHES